MSIKKRKDQLAVVKLGKSIDWKFVEKTIEKELEAHKK